MPYITLKIIDTRKTIYYTSTNFLLDFASNLLVVYVRLGRQVQEQPQAKINFSHIQWLYIYQKGEYALYLHFYSFICFGYPSGSSFLLLSDRSLRQAIYRQNFKFFSNIFSAHFLFLKCYIINYNSDLFSFYHSFLYQTLSLLKTESLLFQIKNSL